MKKTKKFLFLSLLVLIPLTLFFGSKLPGRGYYLTSTLILIEIMLPFFLAFEGRKPQARELVVIAVMCALAVASRVVIPIPNLKPTYAIIMISAIAFGGETGFLIGAMTALASNFFLSQGAHTPWQMFAYGMAGLVAGVVFRKKWLPREPLSMAVFGAALVVLLVGPILDVSMFFIVQSKLTLTGFVAQCMSGLPMNLLLAAVTFLVLFFLGEPLLRKLDRVKLRYGMTECK